MRTSVRIDDDLMMLVKEQAHREGVPVGDLLNRCIRRGLQASSHPRRNASEAYRERVFSMGRPAVSFMKALALSAAVKDEEVLEEMPRRK